jgi:hypothetical protein
MMKATYTCIDSSHSPWLYSLDLQTVIFETRDFSGPLRREISRKSAAFYVILAMHVRKDSYTVYRAPVDSSRCTR